MPSGGALSLNPLTLALNGCLVETVDARFRWLVAMPAVDVEPLDRLRSLHTGAIHAAYRIEL